MLDAAKGQSGQHSDLESRTLLQRWRQPTIAKRDAAAKKARAKRLIDTGILEGVGPWDSTANFSAALRDSQRIRMELRPGMRRPHRSGEMGEAGGLCR